MPDSSDSVESFYDEHGETLGLTGDYEHLDPILPDVSGKRVLDAGCGLGAGSRDLADRGAEVVGVDISQEHVETARKRHGDAVEFHRADFTSQVDVLDGSEFDLVVCALALAHVEEWDGPFAEFVRVLDDDGAVVVHAHNPFVDYIELALRDSSEVLGEGAEYTSTEGFERPWGPDDAPMPLYRRPLGECLRPALARGFVLEQFVEPGTGPFESDRYDPDRPPRHLLMRFRYRG